MRPDHITPGHAGIPSTEGYSRDLEGTRQWLEDVSGHADRVRLEANPLKLNALQRFAVRLFNLAPYVEGWKAWEFARGRSHVATTTLSTFLHPRPAPKGWGSTD